MDKNKLKTLLESVRNGNLEVDEAFYVLEKLPYENLGHACVDHHRLVRNGFQEVVFCQGKAVEHAVEILLCLSENSRPILGTRASEELFFALKEKCADAIYYDMAKCIVIPTPHEQVLEGNVLILTAGTADIPVAEEAAVSAETMGLKVTRVFDVGVAGIHRLFQHFDKLQSATVIITVAGMEGALASVVGGLTKRPLIAVPTSVGYGANFGGLSALLTMLNSCASGIGVVNIDNGFGAAALAHAIVKTKVEEKIHESSLL
jgi:pyridinium-3,5-biscarboxylic acid mononucleotide synthase